MWAQTKLPEITLGYSVKLDPGNVAVIGWSTGGHLAMTTAWTAYDTGIKPLKAILNFYGPPDFKVLGMSAPSNIEVYSSVVTARSFG